jgi:hypothetical protein
MVLTRTGGTEIARIDPSPLETQLVMSASPHLSEEAMPPSLYTMKGRNGRAIAVYRSWDNE